MNRKEFFQNEIRCAPHGWGETDILINAIREIDARYIVEVGSWLGRSAIAMARELKARGDGLVVCVDTWLGSDEHWLNPEYQQILGIVNGRPTLYERFLEHIKAAGVEDYLYPLPLTSRSAAYLLKTKSFAFDIAYIDGSHNVDEVTADILAYHDLLISGGIMIGDDWDWASVKQGVENSGLPFDVVGRNWRIKKDG